jgi:hypothetical protein
MRSIAFAAKAGVWLAAHGARPDASFNVKCLFPPEVSGSSLTSESVILNSP